MVLFICFASNCYDESCKRLFSLFGCATTTLKKVETLNFLSDQMLLSNRIVNGDELSAIRKSRFDLHIVNHLCHTVHDVFQF